MKEHIKVVSYSPDWPRMFVVESRVIKEALGANCIEVHHIGSTSVSGLAAKPIIDIMPVVQDISMVDTHRSAMEALGYIAMGEYGIPMRRYFQKGEDIRTHNVHVFEQGNPEIDRHLKFRDWLRTHPNDLEAYASLKQDLASRFPEDIFSYCIGKGEFIASIDKKAGWYGFRFVKALTASEWDVVKHFRQKYFFSLKSVDDPYTWTFNHPEHVHLVLYQGAEIIGYVHIQFGLEGRVAIRIIMVDEGKRNRSVGSTFLALCEKWFRTLGIKSVHAESRLSDLRFYTKNGYVKMPLNGLESSEFSSQDIAVGKIL